MRGRLALAGIRPQDTPVGEYFDASWAALWEFLDPHGEGKPAVLEGAWAELTGEQLDLGGNPTEQTAAPGSAGTVPLPQQHRGGDQDTVAAVRGLADDDLARWVPAYRRALESEDDDELDRLDRHWAHTASFASGQDSLVKAFGDASKATTTRPDGSVAVAAPKPTPVFGGDD